MTPLRIAAALAGVLLACGCGGSSDPGTVSGDPVPGKPAPDFSLPDVNPNSASYPADVSPRQRLGAVSAWYFGHST